MRKYRHGGYEVLPASIRKRVDALGAPLPMAKFFSPYSAFGIACTTAACFAITGFGLVSIIDGLTEAMEAHVHLGGRAYKFADASDSTARVVAVFAAIFLMGGLAAFLYSFSKRTAEVGARLICMVQEGYGSYPGAERKIQDYILDRTEDNLNPDDFLSDFVKNSGRAYMRVGLPLLLLTIIFLLLDLNNFKRLALEGYRTSSYFQLSSTLHPLTSITRIEAGCRPHADKSGQYHAHLRYVLYFESGASLDLYERDLESNYHRLQTIRAYDQLLTKWGMSVTPRHIRPADPATDVDMDALCDAAIVKRYKPAYHDQVQTVLRLPVAAPEPAPQPETETDAS